VNLDQEKEEHLVDKRIQFRLGKKMDKLTQVAEQHKIKKTDLLIEKKKQFLKPQAKS